MTMRVIIALLLLTLVGCRPPERMSEVAGTLVLSDPVVRVSATSDGRQFSRGSGCIVEYAGKKYVLTAWHVLEGKSRVYLHNAADKPIDIELGKPLRLAGDDLVVLPVLRSGGGIPALPLSLTATLVNGPCEERGYPMNGEQVQRRGRATTVVFITDCQIDHGMSGGPVIVNGEVVGVTTSIVVESAEGKPDRMIGGRHVDTRVVRQMITGVAQ
jgi:S1-C subfamily serine protease